MWAADLKVIRVMFLANILGVIMLPVFGAVEFSVLKIGGAVFLYYVFGCLGIVASFHRFHSHGSYQFKNKFIEILWTLFGTLAGSGSALGWATIHRHHHVAPDTASDPHSPVHGVWKTMTLDYGSGDYHTTRDMLLKPYVVILHKYYFLVLGIYVALLALVAGADGVYFGFMIPSVIAITISGLTNFIAHTPALGRQPHDDAGRATNVWWSVLFNCGEGWHNNHHHDPRSYTTKERWWQFDMAGTAIGWVKA